MRWMQNMVQFVLRRLPFPAGEEQPENSQATPDPESPPPASPGETEYRLGIPPEEYVLRMVRAHGGRVKQQQVIADTEWSASAVSSLLSEMEASGQIGRVAVGREKVVCVPTMLPGAATAATGTA